MYVSEYTVFQHKTIIVVIQLGLDLICIQHKMNLNTPFIYTIIYFSHFSITFIKLNYP